MHRVSGSKLLHAVRQGRRSVLAVSASSLLLFAAIADGPLSASAATDAPPVARLSVTRTSSTSREVTADGSASTDTDSTSIAKYRFRFGDGSPMVRTLAPRASTEHTYASPGTYVVRLRALDTAGLISPETAVTVTITGSSDPVAVFAGYYDTHHDGHTQPKPSPWGASSDVIFVARPDSSSGGWDTSAVRIDNTSGATLRDVVVTVDIGSDHFALWGTHDIAPGETMILAQTDFENFDGSDLNDAGCYSCDPDRCTSDRSSTIPVVSVTIDGAEATYRDSDQVLNTNGVDSAGCPYTGDRNDESTAWTLIS